MTPTSDITASMRWSGFASLGPSSVTRIGGETITQAMQAKINDSPSIKSKMDDVAEVVAAVERDPVSELQKKERAGRTDVGDLRVDVNELRRVSEPLCTVV